MEDSWREMSRDIEVVDAVETLDTKAWCQQFNEGRRRERERMIAEYRKKKERDLRLYREKDTYYGDDDGRAE